MGDTVCGIVPQDQKISLRALLAFLNSHALTFYFRQLSVNKANGFYIFKPLYLREMPIPKASSEELDALDGLVARLIEQMSCEDPVATKTQEVIDKRVYRLFGLTAEDIAIIESD